MGKLIFKCPNTGKEFASEFEANSADMKKWPTSITIRLRCQICAETHELKFTDARVSEDVKPARVSRP
jgi:hypothetical protein